MASWAEDETKEIVGRWWRDAPEGMVALGIRRAVEEAARRVWVAKKHGHDPEALVRMMLEGEESAMFDAAPIFTEADYETLHALVFRADYPGYKPSVVEIPNGDGKADTEKKYAHVAPKYLATEQQQYNLMPYLETAHAVAVQAAELVGVPSAFMPDVRYGALRVLDYPPGAISNKHEDFDLFTLMCFRDQPDRFVSYESDHCSAIEEIRILNPQAHLGQLGEAIGLGPATPHEVLASPTRQRSIVYFAIPDHDAVLPDGTTVRAWLNERMARSRTEFKKYE